MKASWWVLLLLGVAPAVAHATVVADWTLAEVLGRSDVVIVGTALETRSVRNGSRVIRETEIIVERTLWGEATPRLVVSQPGGRDGRFVTDVPGTVTFVPGERVLVATHRASDGRRYVVGLCLGAFRVVGDRLHQRVDVPLAAPGRGLSPAPGERTIAIADVERALAGRRR